MRFKQHVLNEMDYGFWEELSTTLTRDCMPYIKELKGCKSLLCRGSKKGITGDMIKVNQRQNRKPLLIDTTLHQMMDEYTNDHWGFRSRSQSTFTTNKEHNARMYGRPYVMFPIGDFNYAWNDNVYELYRSYDGWDSMVMQSQKNGVWMNGSEARDKVFSEEIEPYLQKYQTRNLNTLLKQPGDKIGYSEAIINCKSHYLINPEWRETLMRWFGSRFWKQKKS